MGLAGSLGLKNEHAFAVNMHIEGNGGPYLATLNPSARTSTTPYLPSDQADGASSALAGASSVSAGASSVSAGASSVFGLTQPVHASPPLFAA